MDREREAQGLCYGAVNPCRTRTDNVPSFSGFSFDACPPITLHLALAPRPSTEISHFWIVQLPWHSSQQYSDPVTLTSDPTALSPHIPSCHQHPSWMLILRHPEVYHGVLWSPYGTIRKGSETPCRVKKMLLSPCQRVSRDTHTQPRLHTGVSSHNPLSSPTGQPLSSSFHLSPPRPLARVRQPPWYQASLVVTLPPTESESGNIRITNTPGPGSSNFPCDIRCR